MKWFFLSVLVLLNTSVWAHTDPAAGNAVDTLSQKLEATKAEVDKFKTDWDRTRLETTLYEQRSQRAYQRWVKAAKSARAKALAARDKADLELQMSVERRKLVFSKWQAAQLRQTSQEAELKALGQDEDTKAIEAKIQQLQTKLNPLVTPSAEVKP